MYARQNADGRPSRGLRIPSNYSGNAFRDEADTPREEPSTAPDMPKDTDKDLEKTVSAEKSHTEEVTAEVGLSGLFGKGGSGGIGLEELLILGLVFLISQNDTRDDLSFLLLLLLFIR